MAFDVARNTLVLFGGSSGTALLGDTWVANGSTWTASAAIGPNASDSATMVWDPTIGRVVLFGGLGATEQWQWDGTQWTQVALDRAPKRGGQLEYDLPNRRIVMLSRDRNLWYRKSD